MDPGRTGQPLSAQIQTSHRARRFIRLRRRGDDHRPRRFPKQRLRRLLLHRRGISSQKPWEISAFVCRERDGPALAKPPAAQRILRQIRRPVRRGLPIQALVKPPIQPSDKQSQSPWKRFSTATSITPGNPFCAGRPRPTKPALLRAQNSCTFSKPNIFPTSTARSSSATTSTRHHPAPATSISNP